MTVSTDSSTPVDYLLSELGRVKAENRHLRQENRRLREGRARWRDEARAWKWGAQHKSGTEQRPPGDLHRVDLEQPCASMSASPGQPSGVRIG